MNKTSRLVLAASAAAAFIAVSAVPGAASRIDNDTDTSVRIWFDCGVSCGNYYDLSPHSSAGRPGKSGKVQMGFSFDETIWACEEGGHGDRASVDSHGEVTLTGWGSSYMADANYRDVAYSPTNVRWTMINSKNKVTGTKQHGIDASLGFHQLKDHGCWSGTP